MVKHIPFFSAKRIKLLAVAALLLLLCFSASAASIPPLETASGSLAMGDSGEEVRKLQEALETLGYYYGPADGGYSLETSIAVLNYQKDNGLVANGIADAVTRRAIFASADNGDAPPQSKPIAAIDGYAIPLGFFDGRTVSASYSLSGVSIFAGAANPGIQDEAGVQAPKHSRNLPHAFHNGNQTRSISDR